MDLQFTSGDYVICRGEDSFFAGRIITPIMKYSPDLRSGSDQVRHLVQNFDGNVLVKHEKQMRKATRQQVVDETLMRARSNGTA